MGENIQKSKEWKQKNGQMQLAPGKTHVNQHVTSSVCEDIHDGQKQI